MAAGRGSINDPSLRSENSGQTPHDFNRICRRNGLAKKRSTVFNDPCEAERRIRNSPGDGRKLHPKENKRECATRRPMDDETKRLLRNTAVCLRSRKGRLSANRRQVASEGGKQTNRSRRKGGQHTLKALHFLRRSCVAMPLSTRCLADHPPAGGVCLAHRPLSLKTCGQKSKLH